MRTSAAPDATAITASILCIVHCLVLPLAVALIPAATHFLDVPEELHLLLFLLAAPVSALAVLLGYRRHGLWQPAVLAGSGLVLIGAGALAGLPLLLETGVSVAGSFLLLAGHAINMGRRALTAPHMRSGR